jgi:hypothetical protein
MVLGTNIFINLRRNQFCLTSWFFRFNKEVRRMKLMCKNIPIYDIQANIILNSKLVPRQFKDRKDFNDWKKARLFIISNSASRSLVQAIPGSWIERKRQLSLSDCYWIKLDWDNVKFEQITPYLNEFTTLRVLIKDSSLPAETLGGSFLKEWIIWGNGERVMRKAALRGFAEVEVVCYQLSQLLNLPCNEIIQEDESNVIVKNITDLDWMLITYLQMGIKVNGYSPKAVASIYANKENEILALKQILFDAVVGNGDRKTNMGNLAVLKHSSTGEIKFPPMFDFNLAHLEQKNYYLSDVITNIKNDDYTEHAIEFLNSWGKLPNYICEQNRQELLKGLNEIPKRGDSKKRVELSVSRMDIFKSKE